MRRAAVNVQPGQGRQIGFFLAQEKGLDVGDLRECSGVTAGDIEHPIMTGPVGSMGNEPGQVTGVVQHTEVAPQQVFRRPGRPSSLPILLVAMPEPGN
jgi:hypothetical protein